ncbi:MAG: hypothetical protein QE273_00705 [Verrucomicrobiales bacterium]|nr:hypothetical protein [Verrucomicrobiales bacterium]
MNTPLRFLVIPICLAAALLNSCVETTSTGLSSSLGSTESSRAGSQPTALTPLTKHDVALRFLTAYIRLDRNMAFQFATPQAVSKLNWNLSHRGNIPYYDDKMLLQFNGGWARVYFQDVGGTYKIVDLEVHRR